MSDDAPTLAQLLDALATPERDAVVSHIEKVTRERDEYKKLAALLQEANEKLKRGLVGQSAERLPSNDAQLSLAVLRLALGLKDDDTETKPPPDEEQTIPSTLVESLFASRSPTPSHASLSSSSPRK